LLLKELEEEATYLYHPDHLGSVSVVSNHRGLPYERVEYLPFGEVWIEETDPATGYIPFRFTSKELDEETGLYYHGARYYEPTISRWMSADPAGFALVNPMGSDGKPKASYSIIEAANWYAYVSNNPVIYVDPTGMLEENGGTLSGLALSFRLGRIPDGWKEVTGDFSDLVFRNDETGFNARLFESEKGDNVLVFEGLNPASKGDRSAGGEQAITGSTEGQFEQALELVGDLLEEEGIDASNLTLTGSSLGGALAAYAGSHKDIRTITFNAAGVHPDNVGPYAGKVTNYYMSGDILTRIQNTTPLPAAIGEQIRVTPTLGDFLIARSIGLVGGRVGSGTYLHLIGPMHRALKK